jgi:hypothetical protein
VDGLLGGWDGVMPPVWLDSPADLPPEQTAFTDGNGVVWVKAGVARGVRFVRGQAVPG